MLGIFISNVGYLKYMSEILSISRTNVGILETMLVFVIVIVWNIYIQCWIFEIHIGNIFYK